MEHRRHRDSKSPSGARCLNKSLLAQSPGSSSPTLNLMEELLLTKMERQSLNDEGNSTSHNLPRKNRLRRTNLSRTDSTDSQTSASTFSSMQSNDSSSTGGGGEKYCGCDDCLLGIADRYKQAQGSHAGRKKVNRAKKNLC